jgi:Ca2+-transporting ATPase
MDYAEITARQALAELATASDGLTHAEARQRARAYGPNQLRDTTQPPLWRRIAEPFKSLFVIILLAAAALSIATGRYLDAAVMSAVLGINAIIYYAQRYSANHVLATLKTKDKRKVVALRAGQPEKIATTDLVPGDIVLLVEGAKVPADGRLIVAKSLAIDESVLTGESRPVSKTTHPVKAGAAMHERINMVYTGSLVRAGSGEFVVTAIGNDSELGHIAELSESKPETSPLQRKIDKLAAQVVVIVGFVLALIFGLSLYRGLELSVTIRFLLSLAVAAIPEGLPVALTLVLLFSVQRMAKRHALVRRLGAIETLGQVSLIATDKTGTMTLNDLELAKFVPYGTDDDQLRRILRRSLSTQHGHTDDPLEALIARSLPDELSTKEVPLESLPFEQSVRLSGALWQSDRHHILYIKGAPENVIAASDLSRSEAGRIHEELTALSAEGYRVIAVGYKITQLNSPDLHNLHGLTFAGLVAMADGLRPGVTAAVRAAHKAGINVVMLTGDNPSTATTIAREAGIIGLHDNALSGASLEALSPERIRGQVSSVQAYARVLPEHKYAVLNAYHGHLTTAMTGDGVNDVSALVKADVGIAVGRGSDAAKEAADIILLDNSFTTIVEIIKSGRAILANVRKMLMYLFATTLGEVGTIVGALLLGIPLPVTAIQILWINMITDGITVIPLGLEAPEINQMKQPPVAHDAPLLSRRQVARVILSGGLIIVVILAISTIYRAEDPGLAQTMAFLCLVVIQWANALSMRSEYTSLWSALRKPNRVLTVALTVAVVVQALIQFTPAHVLLETKPIGPSEVLIIVAVFIGFLMAAEAIRLATRPSKRIGLAEPATVILPAVPDATS